MTDVTHRPIYAVYARVLRACARNGDNRAIRHICHSVRKTSIPSGLHVPDSIRGKSARPAFGKHLFFGA
jgi:hypothetical protein